MCETVLIITCGSTEGTYPSIITNAFLIITFDMTENRYGGPRVNCTWQVWEVFPTDRSILWIKSRSICGLRAGGIEMP